MENEDVEENNLLNLEFFKSSFKQQDVTKLANYQKWKKMMKKKKIKVVKCPICWSYEKDVQDYHHKCIVCHEEYCQKCLKILENGRRHDHPLDCCQDGCIICCMNCCDTGCRDICTSLHYTFAECSNSWNHKCYEYLFYIIMFLFGFPTMLAIKYCQFYIDHRVIDSCFPHWFFTVFNFFTNIIYCILYTIFYFEIALIIFAPSIIYWGNIKFIGNNMYDLCDKPIEQMPIFEYFLK